MELKISAFIHNYDMFDFAHSAFEGGQMAGVNTWNSAIHASKNDKDILFVNEKNRNEIENYVREFGAWSIEEIQSWNDYELNALLLQFIAGSYREWEDGDSKEFDQIYCDENPPKAGESDWYFYVGI